MSDFSSTYPTQSPVFAFDAKAGKLDSRISFSRTDTPATYAAPSAVHYWSNEKHLSSENLVRYSNDLSNGDWTKARVTVESTNNTAPDGTSTASSLLETTDNSTHTFFEDYTSVVGVSYTHVWYAKSNGRTKFVAYAQGASCVYDLTAVTATASGMDAVSITAVGTTGWYKCVATETATTTSGRLQIEFNNGSSTSYTGDVTKGLFFWGFNISSTGQTVTDSVAGSIHREYSSTLKSVATSGQPRFEYSPTDGQSEGSGTALGLLVESQATNKATYSEDFTNATYNKYRATIESASAISPDGTLTASLLREDATASNTHYLNAVTATGLSVGTTKYAVSIFVKAAGRSKIKIYDNNQNTSGSTTFDLSSGTVVTGGGSIQSCGNGWYRCTIIPTCNHSATSSVYIQMDNGSGTSYTGDNFSGILVWGYQLETGVSASSSYIKSNSGSSTTRSADSCSVVDATLFSSGEHTIIWEGDLNATTVDARIAQLSDGTTDNRIRLDFDDGDSLRLVSEADDVSQVSVTFTTDLSVGSHKVAATVKTDEAQLILDGTRRQLDTSGVVPSGLNELAIMKTFNASSSVHDGTGHCKRITYFNVALSQTEAEALTSNP